VRFVIEAGGETIPRTVAADAVRFVSNDAESPLYVHADHLATPQKMTDQAASLVWNKVQRPFGETFSVSGAASGPGGNPKRFPGQLHDPETGFNYNDFRDYDPTTGRYLQSDPIGLDGGLNTYAYVGGNPIFYTDPSGLKTYQCRKPLDKLGGTGTRSGPDTPGNPFYHQYSCVVDSVGKVTCGGQTSPGNRARSPGRPNEDEFKPERCDQSQPDNQCFEEYLMNEWNKPRPPYGIPFGTDCQEYDNDVNRRCRIICNLDSGDEIADGVP
jgi:RHS repeat-associated protein